MARTAGIGASIERIEDPALLSGATDYTDDLVGPGTLHAAILRSQFGHARLEHVDTDRATDLPGVIAAFTAEDVAATETPGTLPLGLDIPGLVKPDRPMLATDRVRYQGEPIAVVVAEDRYTAHDALELIDVGYDRLAAVIDPVGATDDDVPTIHAAASDNVAIDWEIGDVDAVTAAFDAAAHTVSLEHVNQRLVPNAIEPRAVLAEYDEPQEKLSVTMTTQNPHRHQLMLSRTLGVPENEIRVVAPAVGGGFGSKGHHYPDEAIVAWSAMQVGRPVSWQATRRESFLADTHGRNHVIDAQLALDEAGTFTGLRVRSHAGLGGYPSTAGPGVATGYFGMMLAGQYGTPAIHCRVLGTFTNTAPIDAYRGAGRPEAIFLLERLVDLAVGKLDVDPAELRRRNYVEPEAFPYRTPVASVYGSGEYEAALERVLELVEYDSVRDRQARLREDGRYVGIGLASFIELCGNAPSSGDRASDLPTLMESSVIRVHPGGTVTAFCGTADHGQGHLTTFAQVVSETLGVPLDDVEVVEGDTGRIPQGTGTFGSRSAAVGGSSLVRSAEKVIEKARRLVAHRLEVEVSDVRFEDGEFFVSGAPDRSMPFQEVATLAYQGGDVPERFEPGLEATTFYDPENFTFPFGTHAAVVEVDTETGDVDLVRYVAVDDCGVQLNPMIVEGQVHGGIAQGIGQALYEEGVYDENGTLLSGSLMDYAVPRATHLPDFDLDSTVTPCPHNPLGVKGIGEAGTIGAPPAVVNAVVDALEPFGVDHVDMPLDPETVWRAIHE